MEILSIDYNEKTLNIFCNIRDKDDLRDLAFILSAFASGYFCREVSPQEILETLEELTRTEFTNDTIYKFLVQMLYTKDGLAMAVEKIAEYKVIEERKLKLIG